jgi:hypothetical protein
MPAEPRAFLASLLRLTSPLLRIRPPCESAVFYLRRLNSGRIMVFMDPSGFPDTACTVSTDKYSVGIVFGALRFIATLLVASLLCVPPLQAQDVSTPAGAHVGQSSESRQVWVNTATGVYHYPGTRWYGNTKQGQFMNEAEARTHGYRPARNGQ